MIEVVAWIYLAVLGSLVVVAIVCYAASRRNRLAKQREQKSPNALAVLNPPLDPDKSPNPERTKERLAWFEKAAEDAVNVKLRPPPAPKGPIMAVKGEIIPCPGCSLPGSKIAPTAFPSPVYGGHIGPVMPAIRDSRCGACKDRGYIFMQYN